MRTFILYLLAKAKPLPLLLAFSFLLAPGFASAQSSGPQVNTCSTQWVDWGNYIQQTVCLYGDKNSLTGYVDTEDYGWEYLGGDSTFVVAVMSEAQIYDPSGTLVADSGMGSGVTSIVPQLNVWYTLQSQYNQCYDPQGMGSYGDCYWQGGSGGGQSATAEVTPEPSIVYPAYKLTSIIYPAPGNRSSAGMQGTVSDGLTSTIGSSITQGRTTNYSFGGSFLSLKASVNLSFGVSNTTGNSSTDTETFSNATGIALANASGNPNAIDHRQDLFLIWLDPAVSIAPTGNGSATYTVGTQTDGSGNPLENSIVEVTAETMVGLNGVSFVDPAILNPQNDSHGNPTLPGLASICSNLNINEYKASACTLGDQCGCTANDFAPIIAQDPLLQYNGVPGNPFPTNVSPLVADTDGLTCANPNSSNKCRYVPVTSSVGGPQATSLLSGPQCQACGYPTNSYVQTDATTKTQTYSESSDESVSYSWKVQIGPISFNSPTTSFRWTNFESSGAINGHQNSENVTLSSNTLGCYQAIPVFEDTLFHTFVFAQPGNNGSCP